jgi:hypothetical protein
MSDALQKNLEIVVKRLLREAREEPFEAKLSAVKVAIVWFSQSRKLGNVENASGSLIEEMRRAMSVTDAGA